jgi:hypothetical protein
MAKRNIYDMDGDGQLNEIEKICQKYDTNGDGEFSIREVRAIVEDVQEAKKQASQLQKIASGLFVVMIIVCGLLLGLMFAANEASKESHVEGSAMIDLNGNPTKTAGLKAYASVADLYAIPTSVLNKVDDIAFTATELIDGKEVSGSFKIMITGYTKTSDTLTLYTDNGDMTVQATGSPKFKYHGKAYVVTFSAGARRLSERHGFKLYRSREQLNHHIDMVHEHITGRKLKDEDKSTGIAVDGVLPGAEGLSDDMKAIIPDSEDERLAYLQNMMGSYDMDGAYGSDSATTDVLAGENDGRSSGSATQSSSSGSYR